MDINNYIITINNLKYCKDTIRNRLLPVEKVEFLSSRPSDGQDFTLYILNNGTAFYYGSSMFIQVELEKQSVKYNKNKKDKDGDKIKTEETKTKETDE